MTRPWWGAFVAGVAVLGLMAACGGGGSDGDAGKGQRVTDPATVPSSTPIQDPVTYQIRGDQVSAQGAPAGATTPISGTGTTAKKHTVVAGEFCGTIAALYSITVEELLRANRTINEGCTNLAVGDILNIPTAGTTPTSGGGPTPTPRPGAARTYKVQSGDTCGAIASAFGVTVEKLIAANSSINADCTNLQLDQIITIPQ